MICAFSEYDYWGKAFTLRLFDPLYANTRWFMSSSRGVVMWRPSSLNNPTKPYTLGGRALNYPVLHRVNKNTPSSFIFAECICKIRISDYVNGSSIEKYDFLHCWQAYENMNRYSRRGQQLSSFLSNIDTRQYLI